MIISHKHKFIFVHCRKVAGSSIKVALSKYLGDKDIVIGSLHEIASQGIKLPSATIKSALTLKGMVSLPWYLLRGASYYEALNVSSKYKYVDRLSSNPAHPPAELVMKAYPKEWRTYYKFAFVRNPYDRLVSDYLWRKRSSGLEFSFFEFLQAQIRRDESDGIVHRGAATNLDIISINGQIAVDFVGRYESLGEDLQQVGLSLGLENLKLGVKEKSSSSSVSYDKYYGAEEKRIAQQLVREESNILCYDFPY